MKDAFIPDDLQTANQSLMKKIQYLTSEKIKSDVYIKDLQQSLKINKEAVRIINNEGPNNQAIDLLTKQTELLQKRLKIMYDDNRDLNALLLFQSQIRLQDKSFYQQRVIEFQNRISDLRKYLHDKQDSFSNVVNRLKKYEDLNELSIVDKMHSLKGQFNNASNGNDNVPKQILMKLTQERNFYKAQYQTIMNLQKQGVQEQKRYQTKAKSKDIEVSISNQTNKKYPINPNKQLIRFIKKQKMSNQILQQALNEALQKNQELISYNQKLYDSNQKYQQINAQLRAYIVRLQGRLGDFQENYQRKRLNRTKCDMDIQCYKLARLYNYGNKNLKRQELKMSFEQILPKGQLKKMKRDLDKLSIFMPGSKNMPHQKQEEEQMIQKQFKQEETQTAKKISLAKSGSEPKLGKQQMSDEEIEIDYL